MIDDCLYKGVLHYTRVNAVPRVSNTRLEYKVDVQKVNAVYELKSDPYKMGVRRILPTNQSCARQDIYLYPKYFH